MNKKTYLDFITKEYGDYLAGLGYTKIYQLGTSFCFDKKSTSINQKLTLHINKYLSAQLGGIYWSIEFPLLDHHIIRTILSKEAKAEKDIKFIIKNNELFGEGINLVNEQKVIDIDNENEAKRSMEVVKNYIENVAEPFFMQYSQLKNIYAFLLTATKAEANMRMGGIGRFFKQLFIYKIYNEDKYQQYKTEIVLHFERYPNSFKSDLASLDELITYLENNLTRLRQLYAPEML